MIGYLKGKVLEILDSAVIIDVNGVGYRVEIPSGSLLEAEESELFIHTALRENDLSLWGFPTRRDLSMFMLLLSVSGVGLRTAQTLVFSLSTDKVVSAVMNNSPEALKAPGIGKKTAEKIIIELRDKIEGQGLSAVSDAAGGIVSEKSEFLDEAIEAVEKLGYKRAEVVEVAKELDIASYSSSEQLIKAILIHI